MAQLVERVLGKDEVASSNLASSSIKNQALQFFAKLDFLLLDSHFFIEILPFRLRICVYCV